MELFQIIILSIVQGITEYLPVSSSAHLIIVSKITGWNDQGLIMDIFAHGGSLFAVIIYFRRDLLEALNSYSLTNSSSLLNKIFVATLPIVFVGFFSRDIAEIIFRDLNVIAFSTIIFAFILWYVEKLRNKSSAKEDISLKSAFFIGLAQCLAIVPGTSRSAITIIAALFLGYSRVQALRFSFLLAIPTLLFIVLGEFANTNINEIEVKYEDIAAIMLFSFLSSLLCISIFLRFIDKLTFMPFVYYRLILGFGLLLF